MKFSRLRLLPLPILVAVAAILPRAAAGELQPIFNGKDLEGWDGDQRWWSVVDGMIRGANDGKVPSSTYLFTKESFREFRLTFEVKQTISPQHSTMHSAVAVLGERFADKGENAHGFKGPLLMFCHDWGIWDAYRRNRIEPAGHRGTLKTPSEKKGDWNKIEVLVLGNRIRFVNNGELVFDFTDKPEMLKKSPIGLQLHSNGRPQEFFFRKIHLDPSPEDKLLTLAAAPAASLSPLDHLGKWLALAPESRPDLGKEQFASMPLDPAATAQASSMLWKDAKSQIRATRAEEMKSKVIELGDNKMRFEFLTYPKSGEVPKGGRSLFISMHGGGNTAARANDRQWQNQIRLYEPKEGVYVAPRAPTNTWNLWHQGHIDPMFDRLIENMVVFQNVDPNRVYLMGYSAGGDGVYQLAPRMSDRFAAASMMAGHPNETQPQGLRNLPFMIWMGERDRAYNRNKVAIQWGEKLAALREKDAGGYLHQTHIVQGVGHWMNGKDAAAVPWMAKHTRNPLPERIVWRQDDVTHPRFYWLAVDKENRKAGNEVIVSRKGQQFEIHKAQGLKSLRILLNPKMVDLAKPVTVVMKGKTLHEGAASSTIGGLAESLQHRADPYLMFSASIEVDLPEEEG